MLGAPLIFVGYVEEPPLLAALLRPGCVLLLDEVDRAGDGALDVFLGLLDEGRITAPDGETVEAPGAIVTMTSNAGASDLEFRLRDVPIGSCAEQAVCRDHLLCEGWPAELVGRIGAIAVSDELRERSWRGVAEREVQLLAREFELSVQRPPAVLLDAVRDLADARDVGARAFRYAVRDLLGEAFARAVREGVRGEAILDPGPPPRVAAALEPVG